MLILFRNLVGKFKWRLRKVHIWVCRKHHHCCMHSNYQLAKSHVCSGVFRILQFKCKMCSFSVSQFFQRGHEIKLKGYLTINGGQKSKHEKGKHVGCTVKTQTVFSYGSIFPTSPKHRPGWCLSNCGPYTVIFVHPWYVFVMELGTDMLKLQPSHNASSS